MALREFVVLTHCPHNTAQFSKVASVLFRGSYVECEQYLDAHVGYIWAAHLWDDEIRHCTG